MTPFLNNINRATASGRFIIATGCSFIGLGVLIFLIGIKTSNTERIFNEYLPYLIITHLPFWMLLIFSANEVLRKRFGKIAKKYGGQGITLTLLLLLTGCLFIQVNESIIFTLMEILCALLSLNLTGKK